MTALRLPIVILASLAAALPGALLELLLLIALTVTGWVLAPVFVLIDVICGRRRSQIVRTARHFLLLGPDLFERASIAAEPYPVALKRELRRLPAELRAPAPERPPAVRRASARAAGSRLHVLVLTARLPQLRNDGSWTVFHRLQELARHHDVTVFSFVDDEAEASEAEPLSAFCTVVTHQRSANDRLGNANHFVPERLWAHYSASHMVEAVRRVIADTGFDVIQVEYAEMAHMVWREAAELPALYLVHEPLSFFQQREFEQARGLRKIPRAFAWAQNLDYEMRVVSAFRRLVTLSWVDEQYLHSYLPDLPITSIASGVDSDRVHPVAGSEEQPCITFVGFFGHPPNVDAALWLGREIFPHVRRAMPEVRLRIVGKDPTDEMLAMRELPGVEVTGFVPEVLPWIVESAVIAVPIRLGGGLRGKVLEAWAAGVALVTTTRGGEGFPVAHDDNALVADDAEMFAAHLVACLRDVELRRRLAARGLELVSKQFTPAAGRQRYEQVYAELVSNREGGDGHGA